MSAAGGAAGTLGIDLTTGKERWRQPAVLTGLSAASVSDGVAFAYALSGPEYALIAFDTATGVPLWRLTMATRWTNPSAPVAGNGSVYFAATVIDTLTGDLVVVALDAERAKERWRSPAGQFGRAGELTLASGNLYLGAKFDPTCCLLAFDAESGAELWRVAGFTGESAHPAINGESVYAGGAGYETGVLAVFDATYGGEYWRVSMGGAEHPVQSSPVVTRGQLIVVEPVGAMAESTLVSFDVESGAELWRLAIGMHDLVSPVASGNDLYITGDAVLAMEME